MKKQNKIITLLLAISILSLLSISCENPTSAYLDKKLVMYVNGKIEQNLDSLYLSRYAEVDELVSFSKLAISEADIKLFEKDNINDEYVEIAILNEYVNRKGIYYIDSTQNFTFEIAKFYKITASVDEYDSIYAETYGPESIEMYQVVNAQSMQELNNQDTLNYIRGINFADNPMIGASFNVNLLNENLSLAAYEIIPENRDSLFWLEDTLKSIWKEYPNSVQRFKKKKKYGENNVNYVSNEYYINWPQFYHKGNNTITFYSTDEVYLRYRETFFDPEQFYTNIIGGEGLFTIWNGIGEKNSYNIIIKSNY